MEELKVGNKFHVMWKWYDQIDEIIHQKNDRALIRYHTDYGATMYGHMVKENGKWNCFISSPHFSEGLLYPYFDEVVYDGKNL